MVFARSSHYARVDRDFIFLAALVARFRRCFSGCASVCLVMMSRTPCQGEG